MKPWWDVLGVPRGSDRAVIRRAYARALKSTNPEDDRQGFMALREAYESALNWVDYDDDDYDYDGDVADDALSMSGDVGAARRTEWAEPAVEPIAAVPDPLAEARAAEQADLRRLTTALEAGLRGPWHGDAAALAAKLDAILTAPSLIEIDTRDRIEYWLADLLADTVPRSDAILMPAVKAFGWEQEGNRPPAVWNILSRIDEWRMIRSMRDIDHPLSAGWRALTREKSAGWRRRIRALRPGAVAQVRELFDLADYQTPGIAHSFSPAATVWWRDFLAKPRFGFLDLCALVLGGLIAAIFATNGPTLAWRSGGAVAALAAGIAFPVLRLTVVAPWRARRETDYTASGWGSQGWTGMWLVAALLIIWTPVGPLTAGAIALLCTVSSIWMAVAVGREPRIANALGPIISFGAVALLGGAAFFALTVPEKMAFLAFAAASMLIGAAGSEGMREVLWRAGSRPVAAAILLALLLLSAAVGRTFLPAPPQPLVQFGAAAIAGMVLMHAVRDQHDGGWLPRVAPLLRWALWIVLVIAAIASSPPVDRGISESPMQQLEKAEPGFTALKAGNPGLYAAVAAVWQQQADGKRNRDEAAREIDRLVNIGYRARLAEAPSILIASEFDIRLATMREYRTRDLRACAIGERQGTSPALSKALSQRHYRHALAVAASTPASAENLATGRAIPMAELLRIAARDDAAATRLSDAMSGTAQKAKCDARIAVLEALSALPDADIAKTMRPALIARAGESSSKPEGRQAP